MKKGIAILSILACASCSHYVVNQAGYTRPPKHYDFPYRHRVKPLADLSLIDTTAIYYLHDANYYRNSDAYKVPDRYMRFYADGRVKVQGTKAFPRIEDVNDPEKGVVGYYYLKGDLLRIQLYSDINAGSDQLKFGKVDQNGDVILLHDNPRTTYCIGFGKKRTDYLIEKGSYFNPLVFKKIKLEGMTYQKGNW
ncbi:hypothetical protein HUK80_12630 [Flavobacterium sp. MAH-1]|uniref:Uncharacterized protein n=1 Tax=Flavobacterium agri TaxID=2743471 RepID=A0A7Y8Y3Q6_9FLAO|nr:hypothetical protein [Flavobacterium agri]NUY81746.1 hypothetical protein [Flavobacterium agri]NYA71770.1 hypothetical protein [Flavobacterium agri]